MSDIDIDGEIRRVLGNIRSLRVFARGTDFELLEDMANKLSSVVEERREEAEREAKERAAREAKRQELLQFIAGEGFTPEELLLESGGEGKKRSKSTTSTSAPKYEFEEWGEKKTWNGRGRKPKPIEDAIKAGRKLEDFLIVKQQENS